jgi:DNA-binding response OmpR family regulator
MSPIVETAAPSHDRSSSPFERPPRVLVAEDDREMRRLVIDALRRDGYDVVDVTDGGQLLVRITEFYRLRPAPDPIDLIVTDVRMPVCSGFDIIQGLRDAAWLTPVIIMTAFGDDEARARAKKLNAVLLDKPFEMNTLRNHVRELLHASRGGQGERGRG